MPPTLRTSLLLAAATTFALTAARLAGELLGGPEWLFGRAAGGGGALLGIGWLIPIVGAWFGRRLSMASGAPPRGRALVRVALAAAGVGIVFAAAKTVLGVTVGTFLFVALALPLLAAFAWRAWPELAGALCAYAFAARLPIVVLTVLAVRGGWGTHYELLAPGAPPMGEGARIVVLASAQLCLWVPLTLIGGCAAGLLAARGPRRDVA